MARRAPATQFQFSVWDRLTNPDLIRGKGPDLLVVPAAEDGAGIPAEGKNLVVVAVVKGRLHFRVFDVHGAPVVNTDEARLPTQAGACEELKRDLDALATRGRPTEGETQRVISAVQTIVGITGPENGSSDLNRLLEAVRRDLEWLLNSRRAPLTIPKGMTHLHKSVVTFGLPDFTGRSFTQTEEREELVAQIETLIRDFEPRLTDVHVAFHRVDLRKAQAALHYRIDAMLKIDPAPEPVAFDTVLNVGDRAFSVSSEGG